MTGGPRFLAYQISVRPNWSSMQSLLENEKQMHYLLACRFPSQSGPHQRMVVCMMTHL